MTQVGEMVSAQRDKTSSDENLPLMTGPLARSRPDLPRAFSLYLDLVRFMAAAAVLITHVSSYPFSRDTRAVVHPVLTFAGAYGATAVTVFFVLSGYVIAYVVSAREQTAAAYIASRLSRLYSVVLPALVITYACDAVGQWLRPDFYEIQKVLWKPVSWVGYLSSVLFVNEYQVFRFNGVVPGTNAPFWSLSFEATYYLLAGLVLFARRRYALPIALLTLVLAGRTIAALLPLWTMGFWLYKTRDSCATLMRAPVVWLAMSTAAIIAFPQLPAVAAWDNLGVNFPWGRGPFNRNLLLDYAAGIAFAVHLVAADKLLRGMRFKSKGLESAIRWLGLTTFPMYAMHYPLLCLVAALSPFSRPAWIGIIFVSGAVLASVALFTPVCERLKKALRLRISRIAHYRRPVGRSTPGVLVDDERGDADFGQEMIANNPCPDSPSAEVNAAPSMEL